MFNFLDQTPGWLQPTQDKLGKWDAANPHLLWNGIKSMTYSFTVTMVMTRGDYTKSLKMAGVAAYAEVTSTIFKAIGGYFDIPEVSQNIGCKLLSFYWGCTVFGRTVDYKASFFATLAPSVFAKVLKAPGLDVFGMTCF